MLDEFNIDEIPEEEEFLEEEEEGNRTFMIAAGVIGGGLILLIACLAIYFFLIRPRGGDQEAENQTQIALNETVAAQDAATAFAVTQTAIVEAYTDTPTVTATTEPPTDTPTATQEQITPTTGEVTVAPTTEVPDQTQQGPTADPRTATVQALLTQAAVAQTQAAAAVLTVTPTPTQVLPDTGFIDDFGVPGLLAAASVLVVVIFLVRRLRVANG